MISFFSRFKVFGIFFLFLSVIIITAFYFALKQDEKLPVFNPIMIDPSLVDESIQQQKKYHKIANFKLVNQNGDTITQKDYEDKIYVADFFFTTCQSICPIMTKNMGDVQKLIMNDPEVKLLSHTVTPEIDSVAQLNKYALEKGVISDKWNLVTGDKKQIYELARKSYMAVQDDGDGGPYDMIHTENFMLVDKEKQVRGYYDGTKEEEIKKLLKDIKILKKSYVE